MAGTFTPIRHLYKPAQNEVGWADAVNANMDELDDAASTSYVDAADATLQTNIDAKQALLTGTGLARNTGACTELSGDVTTSGSNVATVVKINGTNPAAIATSGKWSDLQNGTAALTLANGANDSTFNHTSATNWTWQNTTAATAAGVVSSSPIIKLGGHIFSAGADVTATWSIQHVVNTPISKSVTNISETAGSVVTLTVGASHGFTAGDRITCSGLTTGSWLNALNFVITSVAATTITFTDTTAHGAQSSTSTSGTVTQIPNSELQLTPAAGAAEERVIFPAAYAMGSGNGAGSFAFAGQSAKMGFGPYSIANGGLGISGISSSGTVLLGFFTGLSATGLAQERGVITVADNSAGNSALELKASGVTAVSIQGNQTTGTATCGVLIGNGGSGITGTSGTQIGVGIGYIKNLAQGLSFAPTSGTAIFKACVLQYAINQTGGANGAVTGLTVNATETAVGGTHNLFDLQIGATSKLTINNSGKTTTCNGEATAGVGTTYARGATSQKAETGADTNVLTVTPAAVVGLYRITIAISVSAANTATLGWTATWTDSNGTAQAPTNLSLFKNGTAAPALTFAAAANDTYYATAVVDVNNAGTNIVVKTTFTGTSIAYKISATIERIG